MHSLTAAVMSKHDRDAFTQSDPVGAKWLPSRAMRVHDGVLDYHMRLWAQVAKVIRSDGSSAVFESGRRR